MKIKNGLTIVAGVAVFAGTVLAGAPEGQQGGVPGEGHGRGKGGDRPDFRGMMDKADTNNDGKISREEFLAAHTEMINKRFDTMDVNKDGFLTPDERKNRPDMPKDGRPHGDRKMRDGDAPAQPPQATP